jgi:hypothetical protein
MSVRRSDTIAINYSLDSNNQLDILQLNGYTRLIKSRKELKMTKAEYRQLEMVEAYLDNGMNDTAARALSAIIRSTMNDKTAEQLLVLANNWKLNKEADFIV